jgi:N-acetyl sugar amidotransferase
MAIEEITVKPSFIKHQQESGFRICSRTIMDTTDPDIFFDEEGICNHYYEYQAAAKKYLLPEPKRSLELDKIISTIKVAGKGKKYDCLIGLSGGIDSTYVAYLAKQYGLRPLAVHLDNGWDSELAVKNVENIITHCGFDLYTLVVNWEEFRDIQLAYLKASVVDIEVVSDHAIQATMYKLAKENKINYVLSGTNIVTEFIMPGAWLYSKLDYSNLKDIHNQYGERKIKTYPTVNFYRFIYYNNFLKLLPISILNFVDYNKVLAKEIIKKELDWRDYGGKHYESLFTKFYQACILPVKFNIDKRKAHYSTLICSGQMTREDALEEMKKPLYNESELKSDKEYVLKKLGLSENEFEKIMNTPIRSHKEFNTDLILKKRYMSLLQKTAPLRNIFRY